MPLLRSVLVVGLSWLASGPLMAADDSDLLPVEQAFKLQAKAIDRQTIALEWQIAEHYYLYRDRIKSKAGEAATTLGALELPDGEKKHDEFLGDVEVYHSALRATQKLSAVDPAATQAVLKIEVQGCHEVDPKICFPPYKTTLKIDLPAAGVAPAAAPAAPLTLTLGKNLATPGALGMPLPPEQAFVFEAIASSPTEILARWTMPTGYYLYRDKTHVSLASNSAATLGTPHWPNGVSHTDENFGTTTVYFDQIELPIPLQRAAGAKQPLSVTAEFQGCQDGGVCYPVMTRNVNLELPAANEQQVAAAKAMTAVSTAAVAKPAVAQSGEELSEEQALAAKLGSNRWWALLVFFVAGLGLAFTPCVFPMLPILSGIILGAGENISTKRAFVLSLIYVLASCLVFTIAGVIAGLAGKNLQAAFQNVWVLSAFALLFVALSFSMFGFYELQLPSSLQSKIADVSNRQQGGSLLGVAIMGMLSALIVGPCVAPPLAAAVLYISQSHDPLFGGLALFVLSLGMGAPLLVFGTMAGRIRPGAWMDTVKAIFGVAFLALAIWMLSRVIADVWTMALSGALLIGCAVYLGALERLPDGVSGWRRLWKALGILLLIAGAAELIGALAGGSDLLQPLKGVAGSSSGLSNATQEIAFKPIKSIADLEREQVAAKSAGKPVLLDFYADWCVSCKEMEKFTFSKNEVRAALSDFVLLKADVTANDETDQALLRHFELFGPPATLFFGTDAGELRARRLIGSEDAPKFVSRLRSVRP